MADPVFKKFEGGGEKVHFYCANGFASGVYNPLFKKLSEHFSLSCLEMRPLWATGNPPLKRDWTIYANDLIDHIENECKGPVIGIGHSMGATCTILAADKRPDLFKKLILIEPAMLSKPLAALAKLLPKSVMNLTQPAKGTLKKRDRWESREEYMKECRRKKMFSEFDDTAFEYLIEHGVKECDDGFFKLAFPKIWEAHNYTQPPNVINELKRIKIPTIAIRSRPSVFFTESLWKKWKKISPDTVFMENLSFGHLMPLESPEVCFGLIYSGLSKYELKDL